MHKTVEDVLKESADDAEIHREAIVAAILTLAIVDTGKRKDPDYVIAAYKKVLRVLRSSGGTWE